MPLFWHELYNLPTIREGGEPMPKARQHILSERPVQQRRPTEGRQVTQNEIQRFLTVYESLDRVEGTVKFYQRKLRKFYQDLPEDKTIRHGTLEKWREQLLKEGYAPNTVNSFLSAANAFLDYIGHREFQLAGQLREERPPQPELSRAEYLHLLRTAKAMEKERVYLLMKVFATTGLLVQDLEELTVEAVKKGQVICKKNRSRQLIVIPGCIQKELLSFAERNGIRSGPLFLTRDGRPMYRTHVYGVMKPVCEAAGITDGRGSPKGLRKLYLNTRAAVESNVALLVEQAMERQLDQEQLSVGWEER